MEDREYLVDRLDFVRNQLNLLIGEIKKRIKAITEEVEQKVVYTHAHTHRAVNSTESVIYKSVIAN